MRANSRLLSANQRNRPCICASLEPPAKQSSPARRARTQAVPRLPMAASAGSTPGPAIVCYHYPCPDGVVAALAAHLHFEQSDAQSDAQSQPRWVPNRVFAPVSVKDLALKVRPRRGCAVALDLPTAAGLKYGATVRLRFFALKVLEVLARSRCQRRSQHVSWEYTTSFRACVHFTAQCTVHVNLHSLHTSPFNSTSV